MRPSWQRYTVALKPGVSDGWHYQTSSNLINNCPHTGIIEVGLLPRRKIWEQSDSRKQILNVPHVIKHTHLFSVFSRRPVRGGFLLASPCLFCWMLCNTDVSLKYWIQPSLGCELCLLLREEKKGKRRREERWGSLNKLPSVYLIYGAIRSVQCRLKLNFSSCEAS